MTLHLGTADFVWGAICFLTLCFGLSQIFYYTGRYHGYGAALDTISRWEALADHYQRKAAKSTENLKGALDLIRCWREYCQLMERLNRW